MPIKFTQRPSFSDLRFFNEPEISGLGTPKLKSFSEDLCSGFLRPEKIHRPQPGLNSRTLALEARTLPRDRRGGLPDILSTLIKFPFIAAL